MAFWTNLVNALFIAGRPILGSTGLALRDNLIAFIEGAPSAPRLLGEAVATASNGLPVLTITATGGNELTEGAAPVDGTISTSSTVFIAAKSWTISCFTGTARLAFSHGRGTTAGDVHSRVMLNGVSVASWTTGGSSQPRSVDIDIVPGDTLSIEHRANSSSITSNVTSISLSGSNAYRPVSAYRRVVT